MAKKLSQQKEQTLYQQVIKDKEDSITEYKTVRDSFAEKEALLLGTLKDDYSQNSAKSQVFDPRLSTISIERSARVMAQPPMGKVKGISKNDIGTTQLMNMTIDKYVLPNANSQWSYLTKSRMWDLYSLVYGVMFMMVDWRVDLKSGYIGPDSWLLPIRDCFPQAGAVSIQDSDHFIVSVMAGKTYLQGLGKNWNKEYIKELIEKLDNNQGIGREDLGRDRESHIEEERNHKGGNKIELLTKYMTYGGSGDKGEWITVSPQLPGKILRKIDNPHKNGKLPIIAKYAFPLVDSIYGLGEFERGKTLQYATNSLINLYLDGVKMSIFPPAMINPDGVVRSSIKFQPAAKWLVRSMDAVKQFNVNPQGLQTFNSTYSFLIAALLNQAGTTTTTTTDKIDPGMGKTPQALKMLESRENSRDAWDRFMMDQAQQEVMNRFVNLIAIKQSSKITMRLFEDEVDTIKKKYPEVMDTFGKNGDVEVKSGSFKGTLYDYQIIPGSTAKVDEEQQFQAIMGAMNSYLQFPQIQQAMKAKGKELDIAELYETSLAMSKIPNWDKLIIDAPEETVEEQMPEEMMAGGVEGEQIPQEEPQQFEDPDLNAMANEVMSLAGGIGGIPPTP